MKKQILFLYHSDTNWHNINPLYQLFNNRTDLYDCTVVTVPQKTSHNHGIENITPEANELENESEIEFQDVLDKNAKPEKIKNYSDDMDATLLKNLKIEYQSGIDFEFEGKLFDLIIFGYPYESVMYEKFHIVNVKKHTRKIAYIPYGIDVTTGVSIDLIAHQLPIHYHADAIFLQSEQSKRLNLRFHPNDGHRFYALSTPRFDELYNLLNRPIQQENLVKKVDGRFCVLWNSHFTFTINRWSTFDKMLQPLIEYFTYNPEIALIWRPHPNTFLQLVEDGFMTEYEVHEFVCEIQEAGIIIDSSSNHLDAFKISDCMISDISSLCVEYIGTGKAMLILDNPNGNHEKGEYFNSMFQYYDKTDEPQKIFGFIDGLINGIDRNKKLREIAKKRFVYKFDGQATQRIFRVLTSMIEAE